MVEQINNSNYINVPIGYELGYIEEIASKFYQKCIWLIYLDINELFNFAKSMIFESDFDDSKVVNPTLYPELSNTVNCKDYTVIGVMWAKTHNFPYEIILNDEKTHVYLKILICGSWIVVFDPVKELLEYG